MASTPRALEDLLRRTLSRRRRAHCRSVARLAARLCRRFDVDPCQGVVAGLAHDVARELPVDELVRLAAADGQEITPEERKHPVLLHGRAGAALLAREMPGCGREVLQAVADHVTGRPGMSPLARIVFAADFLAANRGFVDRRCRAGMLRLDLDAVVLAVLARVFAYLDQSGNPVAKNAVALYHELGEQANAQAKVG